MRRIICFTITLICAGGLFSSQSLFASNDEGGRNASAILVFAVFVFGTLAITWIAARQISNQSAFFTAKGGIPPWQNGLAIAGDFMSAATFLGITGLMFFVGYDGYLLSLGIVVGWPLMLMVIAERFRNLGRYTFVDVVTYRMDQPRMRALASAASLLVVIFYLIGQMVGAGKLIEHLFAIDYLVAIIIVNFLMLIYVVMGGMLATTWVQMIKALLLLSGGFLLAFLLLAKFDFDVSAMFAIGAEKHALKDGFLQPGGWLSKNILQVLTVGLTMCFGIMGLPHVLMRFFTVKNAADARMSVSIATLIMSVFYVIILLLGFGAAAVLIGDGQYYDANGQIIGGSNLVALHLSDSLGGDWLLGYMSAVTFATILAVVAGLTLAGSATIAHDLLPLMRRKWSESLSEDPKQKLLLSRVAAVGIGLVSLLLGIAFENQNIAVTTSMALAVAASINFPLLLLSMYWRGLTASGAFWGGGATLLITIFLIVLSDPVWVKILGNESAVFPFIYPTVVTMPLCFIMIVTISLLDKTGRSSGQQELFSKLTVRAELGVDVADTSER